MKAQINATISFGIAPWEVTIPVGIAGAVTEKNDPSFRVLHKTCEKPVSMKTVSNEAKKNGTAKKAKASHVTASDPATGPDAQAISWCESCNVEATDTTRGFEFTKGQFLVFTDEEIAEAKGTRSAAIKLTKFVAKSDLLPTLIAKNYFLVPNQHINEGYGLLYQALTKTKTLGIGKQSLWGKESPCAIIASQGFERRAVLMLMILHCWEDLVEPDFEAPIPNKDSKKLAEDFVKGAIDTLEPSDLTSAARTRMNDLIEAKLTGIELPALETQKDPEVTTDIQEMLRRSIAELGTKK